MGYAQIYSIPAAIYPSVSITHDYARQPMWDFPVRLNNINFTEHTTTPQPETGELPYWIERVRPHAYPKRF